MTIDDDIARGKIGKKDEPLVGWTDKKKQIPEVLPPMKARKIKYPSKRVKVKENYWIIAAIIIVVLIAVAILYGIL